jgi:hypothetical protein
MLTNLSLHRFNNKQGKNTSREELEKKNHFMYEICLYKYYFTDLLKSFMHLNKKYGSVMKIWLGPRLHLMITKPEVVDFFLNSNVHLSKSNGYDLFKPWLGDGLLVSTGNLKTNYHKKKT